MNSIFDQRNQKVTYQYNAAGDINFATVQNNAEFTAELIKLQKELKTAIQHDHLSDDAADDAEYNIKKAIRATERNPPQKEAIKSHLDKAKEAVTTSSTLFGLARGIDWAVEKLDGLF